MRRFSRRKFFAVSAGAAAYPRRLGAMGPADPTPSAAIGGKSRSEAALNIRTSSALMQSKRPAAPMQSNEEEDSLPNRIACYAKGLPQNRYGEVDPGAYNALLSAMKSGK